MKDVQGHEQRRLEDPQQHHVDVSKGTDDLEDADK